MAGTLRLRVVTPERELLDQEVEQVVAPGGMGEIGILPDHIPLVTTLDAGRLVYTSGGKREVLAVFGGYAEVSDNVVTILADGAEPSAEIDSEAARTAAASAEKELASLDPGTPEAAAARAELARATARLAATSER